MKTIRTLSVLAALSMAGAAYAQTQTAPNTPSATVTTPTPNPELDGASSAKRSDPLRVAEAAPETVQRGMRVKAHSGEMLGAVASIIPGESGGKGYVVIANPQGIATPVPYTTANASVQNGTLVLDKARFQNAPKVQFQPENDSDAVWQRQADKYWKQFSVNAD
jgi:hypothetical protein